MYCIDSILITFTHLRIASMKICFRIRWKKVGARNLESVRINSNGIGLALLKENCLTTGECSYRCVCVCVCERARARARARACACACDCMCVFFYDCIYVLTGCFGNKYKTTTW